MDWQIFFNYAAGAATFFSAFLALYEYRQRRKTQKFLKALTKNSPGEVAKIEQSSTWAWNNLRSAHECVTKLESSELRDKALSHISSAIGDAAASARMCYCLFNNLLSMQEGEFNTREITFPGKEHLDLWQMEQKSSSLTP